MGKNEAGREWKSKLSAAVALFLLRAQIRSHEGSVGCISRSPPSVAFLKENPAKKGKKKQHSHFALPSKT